MFANTGLVNAVVPENITSENSEGVFANNTKLETIEFLGVDFFASWSSMIGNKYFQNCTALTTIKDNSDRPENTLGTVGSYSFAGCTALKTISIGGEIYIYDHAFADCTGLENIYFNLGECQDGVCAFLEIYDYAFANCTGVDKLYVLGPATAGQYECFRSSIFDGWTANQTIIFLNDFRGTGSIQNLPDWSWWYAYYDKTMLDGCNANIVYREELFDSETVTIDYCGAFGDIYYYGDPVGFTGLSQYDNVKTLNIGKLAPNYCSWNNTTLHGNAFAGFTAEQTINFTYYTYEELLDLIDEGVIAISAFNNCEAKICDKDGNVLVFTGGVITSVTNADGSETLWTPGA